MKDFDVFFDDIDVKLQSFDVIDDELTPKLNGFDVINNLAIKLKDFDVIEGGLLILTSYNDPPVKLKDFLSSMIFILLSLEILLRGF